MAIQTAPAPQLEECLKVLASPVRRKILHELREPERYFPGQEHPYEWGVCAKKIEMSCSLSQSTVSGHLALLHEAGLIAAKKVGQWVFYHRNEAAISRFLDDLRDNL